MTTRSARLAPVVRVAAEREREAAVALGKARSELQMQQSRLQELEGYREEYAGRFRDAGAAGINGTRLHAYRHFLAQLDQALGVQRNAVEAARKGVERRIRQWHEVRGRLKALERVVERLRAEESAREERREQKETDEFAQRFRS